MKIVIQCAATKCPEAGFFLDREGSQVLFVAHPELAPTLDGKIYARPDDKLEDERSWRQELQDYNESGHGNQCGLFKAYELYRNDIYRELARYVGVENLYILSAGWGLVGADFLLPQYDITFSSSAAPYKRRKKKDQYHDFSKLSDKSQEDLYFFGGKDYLPLFLELTHGYQGQRVVFYNSIKEPAVPDNVEKRRYQTRAKTNWHYLCARDFCKRMD